MFQSCFLPLRLLRKTASRKTTLDDTNQVSTSTYSYDTYNNVTDEQDYDRGVGGPGPLLRDVKSVYLWASNKSQYTAANVNLVRPIFQHDTYDGNGKQYAHQLWYYDQTAPQDAPGIVGHDSSYGTGFIPRGNVTAVWQSKVINGAYAGTILAYDIAGNVLSVQDPDNHTTQLSYNDDGSNQYALPTASRNALNQANSSGYNYGIDKPSYTTGLNGERTSYSYNDPLDRVTQVQLPNGAATVYSYPGTTELDVRQDQNTAGDGALKTRTLYDGLGRPVETDSFETSTQYIATTTQYDGLGRVSSTTNPSRPGDGLSVVTSYAYDSLGRTTSVTTPDGAVAYTSYSGNKVTGQDQAGHARVTTTDALGRLTGVTEDPGGLNYQTAYSYDPLGNLTTVKQGSQTRSFSYDPLGRLTQAQNGESGTVQYSYDNAGNLLQRTSGSGKTTAFAYDALNRLTSKAYSDGTPAVSYSYDQGTANGIGQLGSVANASGTANFTAFDAAGNVLQHNEQTAGQVRSKHRARPQLLVPRLPNDTVRQSSRFSKQ